MAWKLSVDQGLTPEKAFAACAYLFPCSKWEEGDLDAKVVFEERIAEVEGYTIDVSDPEYDDNSHCRNRNELISEGVNSVTLTEFLSFLRQWYLDRGELPTWFKERGILCAGTQFQDGGIPGVAFRGGVVRVYWCHPDLTDTLYAMKKLAE